MFSLRFSTLVSLTVGLCSLKGALGVPVVSTSEATYVKRDIPAAPHFVAYMDQSGPIPDPATITGWNVFNLAFLLSAGPRDQAATWDQMSDSDRKATLDKYHAAGIKLMVSAFGETEHPTTLKLDPVQTANSMADFVVKTGLDGIDVDYEDYESMNLQDGAAEAWVTQFTKTLREKLPVGQFIVTHAPLGPWFSSHYTQGAYRTVHKNVGDLIDWYNVQYYNDQTDYETCDNLFNVAAADFPGSAVFEAIGAGVPQEKLVVGKPARAADAPSGGFIEPATLAGCVADAKGKGWTGGVMSWQFPFADSNWIKTVRGSAFPVDGGSTTPTDPGQGGNPPPSGCSKKYTVVSGDTCAQIAQTNGITVDQFLSENPSIDANCSNLQIGVAYCV